ncbi:metallophosphoesterase family protein [Clostridium intestinale]|uniref:Metallophosphoesterase n=1 Tax=Clostridium intestinale TaxID=36845 RepID=A0A7D6VQ23_9CLOT|nr:metallophosphoesterase [Clostridium intestinale]QLY79069.1 metallophosphoesterase [Clostridium intestinale]
MDRVKILHGADFHFDTPFKELSASMGEKRNEDIKKSFESLINIVKEEDVSILLLCGDIFDNKCIKKSTLEFLKVRLESINKTKVFIVAGNHDPLNDRSFYNLLTWPENVHIFSNDMEAVVLEDLKTVVYGKSFSSNYEKTSLLKGFQVPVEHKEYINIMALHGEIARGEQENEYNPLTLEEIRNSKLDYLALGHRHGFSNVKREWETFYAYSGCPEGRGFDELGEKGIIIGEVYKGYNNLKFRAISQRVYELIEVDLTGINSQEEILRSIISSVDEKKRVKNFYKVILKGEVYSDLPINIKKLQYRLKEMFYYIKIIDETTVKLDYDIVKNENSLRGIFLRKVYKKLEEEPDNKESLERALKLAFNALREEDINLDDY